MVSHGNIVLDYHDTLLRESDVALLNGNDWLNDNLIAFWFEYLENELYGEHREKIAFISPQVAQFIKLGNAEDAKTMLTEMQLPQKELILLPINDCSSYDSPGGTHWSLLAYTKQHGFQHYDSCTACGNAKQAKKTAKVLAPLLTDGSLVDQLAEADCVKQENGYDCGLHVICNANAICETVFGNVTQHVRDIASLAKIREARKHLKDIICFLRNKSVKT